MDAIDTIKKIIISMVANSPIGAMKISSTRLLRKIESVENELMQKQQIEFALQQFIGFTHAKKGFPIRELVSSMGLKKEEWDRLNEEEDMALNNLDVEDCEEVDDYFKELSQKGRKE